MRFLKLFIVIVFCLFGLYSFLMNFVEESKIFEHQSEIDYPVDKVFPQFNNLQNFTIWNLFFKENEGIRYTFYTPYEGKDSGMKFSDKKRDTKGDMFIRYSNTNQSLRYQLFEGENENPYFIDVKFIPNGNKTKLIWKIHTPKRTYLKRYLNFSAEDFFIKNIDKSINNLYTQLGNKVSKDLELASVKYDSIMVENREAALLLGVNVSTKNTKDIFFKNVMMNHSKVFNFIKSDLAKKDDEFGVPVLLMNPVNLKDKVVSYFYGIPISKQVLINDNNFSYQTVNPSKVYVMFFKGNYNNRTKNIQELMKKAKKDTLKSGQLLEEFLEEPIDFQDVKIKLSLLVN